MSTITEHNNEITVQTGDMITVFRNKGVAAEFIAMLQEEVLQLRDILKEKEAEIQCYEGMKQGVAERIADLEAAQVANAKFIRSHRPFAKEDHGQKEA